jgi:hypothetical protein
MESRISLVLISGAANLSVRPQAEITPKEKGRTVAALMELACRLTFATNIQRHNMRGKNIYTNMNFRLRKVVRPYDYNAQYFIYGAAVKAPARIGATLRGPRWSIPADIISDHGS